MKRERDSLFEDMFASWYFKYQIFFFFFRICVSVLSLTRVCFIRTHTYTYYLFYQQRYLERAFSHKHTRATWAAFSAVCSLPLLGNWERRLTSSTFASGSYSSPSSSCLRVDFCTSSWTRKWLQRQTAGRSWARFRWHALSLWRTSRITASSLGFSANSSKLRELRRNDCSVQFPITWEK